MVQENVIQEKTEIKFLCGQCKAEITPLSKFCDTCGTQLAHAIPKAHHWGVKKVFAWFIGIAVALFIVIVAVGFHSSEYDPYFMAEIAIKDRLKSPDSAEFPDAFDYKNAVIMTPITNGYRVVSWVKAKNAFGVTLKRPWSCDVGHKAGIEGWYVIGTCGLVE
jgi:hypothetical protein